MVRYGIYGYETTEKSDFDEFKIIPLSKHHSEVKALASDLNNYNLTGFLEINRTTDEDERNFIFDLQGALSFIDQKSVIITNSLHKHETYERLDEGYPENLPPLRRSSGGGQVIISDAFSSTSRRDFICKILDKLNSNITFRNAFFKSIAIFRGIDSFIDINYYLLFSALESLSRSHLNDFESKNCSTPIAKFLKSYGFDISQDNTKKPFRSVSTYTHLRNALFHNGMLESEVNINGQMVTYTLEKYYSVFRKLVQLTIIKYVDFDDGYMNWNCWLDRMPFKPRARVLIE